MERDPKENTVSGMWCLVGSITNHRKIFNEKECLTPREKYCWQKVGGIPFLYVEGDLINGNPNAKAAEALIKYCHANPDIPLKVGLSVEGMTLQRKSDDKNNPDYNILDKTIAEGVSLTVKPANSLCFVQPMQDLMKSEMEAIQIPEKLMKSLMDLPEAATSFKDKPEVVLNHRLERLRKSLEDVKKGGVTSIKCWNCGTSERMFKSSISNRCSKCNGPRSMSDIWSALNE